MNLDFFRFDQVIYGARKITGGDEWNVVYREMQAQLYFLAGTLSLKRAQHVSYSCTVSFGKKLVVMTKWHIPGCHSNCKYHLFFLQQEHLSWLDATEMAASCFVACYAYEPPHTKAPWYVKASEEDKKVFDRMRLLANLRASQTGKNWISGGY